MRVEHRASPDGTTYSSYSERSLVGAYLAATPSPQLACMPKTAQHLRSQTHPYQSPHSDASTPTAPIFQPFSPAPAHARAQTSVAAWQPIHTPQYSPQSALSVSTRSAQLVSPIITSFVPSQRSSASTQGHSPVSVSASSYGVGSEQWTRDAHDFKPAR